MTKTVDGMCADCWGVKDATRARKWLPRPKTRPLFDDPIFDLDDPVELLWLIGTAIALALVLLIAAGRWI